MDSRRGPKLASNLTVEHAKLQLTREVHGTEVDTSASDVLELLKPSAR